MPKGIAFVLPVLATLLLAGCVTIDASPPAASPSDSTPPASPSASPSVTAESFTPDAPANQCLTADLSVSIKDEGSSAGQQHAQVIFTNHGPACVLDGFPDVQVIGSGTPMGSSSEEDSSTTASPVNLDSHGTAIAQLISVIIDPGGGPLGDACVVGHGDGYNVTPPHSLQPIPVSVGDVPVCTNGAVFLTAGPVGSP